jgi:hypothetical protein
MKLSEKRKQQPVPIPETVIGVPKASKPKSALNAQHAASAKRLLRTERSTIATPKHPQDKIYDLGIEEEEDLTGYARPY